VQLSKCALPSQLLLGVLIANIIITVISVVAMYIPRHHAKSDVLRMLNWANVLVLVIMGLPISIYAEGGSFTAAPVVMFLMITTATLWAREISEVCFNFAPILLGPKLTPKQLMALPIFSMNPYLQRRVRTVIRLAFIGMAVGNGVVCLALAIIGRTDDFMYNATVVAYNFWLLVSEIIFCAIALHYGRQLEKSIDESAVRGIGNFQGKIRAMKFVAVSLVVSQFPPVIGTLVFAALGSMPYYWVIHIILFLATPPSIAWSTVSVLTADNNSRKAVANMGGSAKTSSKTDLTIPASPSPKD